MHDQHAGTRANLTTVSDRFQSSCVPDGMDSAEVASITWSTGWRLPGYKTSRVIFQPLNRIAVFKKRRLLLARGQESFPWCPIGNNSAFSCRCIDSFGDGSDPRNATKSFNCRRYVERACFRNRVE